EQPEQYERGTERGGSTAGVGDATLGSEELEGGEVVDEEPAEAAHISGEAGGAVLGGEAETTAPGTAEEPAVAEAGEETTSVEGSATSESTSEGGDTPFIVRPRPRQGGTGRPRGMRKGGRS